jgi:uncharacterized membrane protein YbhN (UPF0104 family)
MSPAPPPAPPPQAPPAAPAQARPRRRRGGAALQLAGSAVVVAAVFALVVPKIASYSSVWATVSALPGLRLAGLALAMVVNMVLYWLQLVAALPGLSLGQAAVNNQSSTTIANVVPGGGALAVGLAVAMFRSWGFTPTQITLLVTTTGVWNSFMKLGLPVVALGLLGVTGHPSAGLVVPALVGVAILAASVAAFALSLTHPSFAGRVGHYLGRAWSRLAGLAGRPPAERWADKAIRFRGETVGLLQRRWPALTAATLASQLALWVVLLLSLRACGVTGAEVSWVQVLAVFAFARLLSAAPITPGGLGVVELALIAGLYAAGHAHATVALATLKVQVAAAALLYRALTYGLQIPFGGVTYLIWQHRKRWRRPVPGPGARREELAGA